MGDGLLPKPQRDPICSESFRRIWRTSFLSRKRSNHCKARGSCCCTSLMHQLRLRPSLSTSQISECLCDCDIWRVNLPRKWHALSSGTCLPSLTFGGHCGGMYRRYEPRLTAKEKVVTPRTSALYRLNDWKLTTSTCSSPYRHAVRDVNFEKPTS